MRTVPGVLFYRSAKTEVTETNPLGGGECSMTKVMVKEGEPFEKALKRFKKKVEAAGILKEVRRREHYLKPSIRKKEKQRSAEKRRRRSINRARPMR